MAKTATHRWPGFNPFYVLLVVVGTAFCVTAFAYGVMALKQMYVADGSWQMPEAQSGFMILMDRYGPKMMLYELVILAVASLAAMGTDRFWTTTERKGAAQ